MLIMKRRFNKRRFNKRRKSFKRSGRRLRRVNVSRGGIRL